MSENAPSDDENALPSGWRRFAAVVKLARGAILIAGTDGHIVLFNPAAERMFGCSAADALGHALQYFLAAVGPQTGRTTVAGVLSGDDKKMVRIDLSEYQDRPPISARWRDGSHFHVHLEGTRVVVEPRSAAESTLTGMTSDSCLSSV